MSDPILELEDVSIAFDGQVVLAGVTLSVRRGELLCITGPSGSGKTLLLKLCAGLLKPTRGVIRRHYALPGAPGAGLPGAGFVFEYGGLISNMTVFNNVALPLRYHTALSEEEIAAEVRAILARLRLTEVSDVLPARLSLGTRKLASIARAIAMRPQIIYYDEPTLGLDRAAARMVESLMNEVRQRHNPTSLVVTHSHELLRRFADRVVVLGGGAICGLGTIEELSVSEDPSVRAWFADLT